jgi:hypothetical protein
MTFADLIRWEEQTPREGELPECGQRPRWLSRGAKRTLSALRQPLHPCLGFYYRIKSANVMMPPFANDCFIEREVRVYLLRG